MRVIDLIGILEYYDDDTEVCFQPCNSMYVDGISYGEESMEEVRMFYGNDREFLVLKSGGQLGAI